MNRKIMGFAKALNALVADVTPKITQSTGAIKEVTGIGTGSHIHQNATKVTIARSL